MPKSVGPTSKGSAFVINLTPEYADKARKLLDIERASLPDGAKITLKAMAEKALLKHIDRRLAALGKRKK